MEFSNINLIRLGDGNTESPSLYVFDDLDYMGDEYICVQMINKAETMPYGNYFFMQVVKGLDGQRGCRLVSDIETGDALRQITGMAKQIEKMPGQIVPRVAVLYSLRPDRNNGLLIDENRYTYLRRREDGKIGCDRLGKKMRKLADWIPSDGRDSIRARLKDNRHAVSVLHELSHNNQRYLYIREKDEAENWYFIRTEGDDSGPCPERVGDESLACALWTRILNSRAATKWPQRN